MRGLTRASSSHPPFVVSIYCDVSIASVARVPRYARSCMRAPHACSANQRGPPARSRFPPPLPPHPRYSTVSRFFGILRRVVARLELTLTRRRRLGKGIGDRALPRSGSGFKCILDAPRAVRDFLRLACAHTRASADCRGFIVLCLL
jgi:hypothetical protein